VSIVHPSPVRLYCIPHAGATSSVYRPWKALATLGLQIVGVDPAGRGTRSREAKIADYTELVCSTARYVVDDLLRAREDVGHLRYATFGHSFGALQSLAVAAAVQRVIGQPPLCTILSAALPPRLQPPGDETTPLTDAELLDKIARDGGTEPALLSSGAMAGYLVGLMREDYAIRRQFPAEKGLRVDFPLTLVAARDDRYVLPAQMWAWSEHSGARSRRLELAGGHFAAVRNPAKIVAIVCAEMGRAADALSGKEC